MHSKRLGYVAAWLAVTGLATVASFAAVDLVGATSASEPSPSLTFAATTSRGASTVTTEVSSSTTTTVELTTTSLEPTTTAASTTSVSTATTISGPPTTVGTTTATTVPDTTTTMTTTTGSETGPFSFSSDGGTVTITCLADDISLSGAIPGMGFTVEIEDAGPGEVRVEFRAGETEVEVRIECEDGIPDAEIREA